MANEPDIQPTEIQAWLDQNDHSREWLAEATGSSFGTVAGWLAKGKPRAIPAPTLRLIERLMCDDLLGEPQYSYSDAKVIRQAMNQEGYASLRDFVRDAVVANARRITGAREKIVEMRTAVVGDSTSERSVQFWIDLRGGVAAGSQISSQVIEEPIPAGKEYPDDHYALRVFGQSMEPQIPDGSTIVVKSWPSDRTPKKGVIVVYSDGSGSTLKVFGYRKAKSGEESDSMGNIPVLRSLNPAFQDVQTMDGGKIDAVYVETISKP